MYASKLTALFLSLIIGMLFSGPLAWAQDQELTPGSKSFKSLSLNTISPYLPTAAAYPSNNAATGVGVGAQTKEFDDLELKIDDVKLADIVIVINDSFGSGTITTDEIKSIGSISGAGVTVDLWGGFAEFSFSQLSGKIRACGSTTIDLTGTIDIDGPSIDDSDGGITQVCVDGLCGEPGSEPAPESVDVSYCVEGKIEILELDLKARLLRVDLRLGDGQWLYLAAGTTVSIESYKIELTDGQTIDGTSISVGGFIEAGITLSSSVRISITGTNTFTGTGDDVKRDDGTFVTAGVSIGL